MGILDDIYKNQLGREADADGLAYWQNELDSGKMSVDQIRSSIGSSKEADTYRTLQSNLTNARESYASPTSLESIYKDQLGREADADGLAYWQNEVDSGNMTLGQVQSVIRDSDEALDYRYTGGVNRALDQGGINPLSALDGLTGFNGDIYNLYRTELGRNPDAAGLAYWTAEAEKNGIDTVKQAFMNTKEAQGYNSASSTTGTVNPDPVYRSLYAPTETVQGQLDNLLSKENPLLQRARYKGQDIANSRGLLNSSMGAEAAEAAMIDASLGIAQADANTYYDQSKTNQSYANQFSLADRQNQYNQDNTTLAADEQIRTGAYDVTANTQGAYLEAIDKITNNAAVSINEIETSQNITQEEKDAMIQNTIERRDADLSWTRNLYSNMPTWDFSWINLETMPSAPGIA